MNCEVSLCYIETSVDCFMFVQTILFSTLFQTSEIKASINIGKNVCVYIYIYDFYLTCSWVKFKSIVILKSIDMNGIS